jgi:hypothetical protein
MRSASAEALARALAEAHLEPEACQAMASRLLGRRDADPVAVCEVAFARAALLRYVIVEVQAPMIADRMNGALDAFVATMFKGAHTAQTAARYGPRTLAQAAADAIATYQPDAFLCERLARAIAQRLALADGAPASTAADLARLTERAVVAMTRVRIR